MEANIWAIYLFIRIHNLVEGNSPSYIAALVRYLPQDVLLEWSLMDEGDWFGSFEIHAGPRFRRAGDFRG